MKEEIPKMQENRRKCPAKDTAAKVYLMERRHAAEICNCLLFHGEKMVREDALQYRPVEQYDLVTADDGSSVTDNRVRDLLLEGVMYRDISRGNAYLMIGVEVQSTQELIMPFRIQEYNMREYRSQVKSGQYAEKGKLYPVVTILVNFSGSAWGKPLSLGEFFPGLLPELSRYVGDFRVPVLDPYGMDENSMNMYGDELNTMLHCFRFREDLKGLTDFLKEKGDAASIGPDEVNLLNTYLKAGLPMPGKGEENLKMCKAFDDLRALCRAEGMAEGRAEGRAEGMAKGRAEGVVEGMERGRTEGIRNLVSFCKRLNYSDAMTIKELSLQYSLSEERAKSYL